MMPAIRAGPRAAALVAALPASMSRRAPSTSAAARALIGEGTIRPHRAALRRSRGRALTIRAASGEFSRDRM